MATRLYPLTTNSVVWSFTITSLGYPAGYRGTWDKVQAAGASSTVNLLHPAKYGSGATTTSTQTDTSAVSPYRAAVNKWISVPLKGTGTISGTFDLCVPLLASAADADFAISIHVWVSVGLTPGIRGTLISNYSEALSPGTEWPTTAAFLSLLAPVAVTPVDWQDGDRIVVEIGFVSYNAFSTSRTGTVRRGAVSGAPPAGTDLPDALPGSTNVTTEAGWVEFSSALTFVDIPANDLCVNATVIPAAASITAPYEEGPTNTERATWSADDPDPSCSPTSRYTTRWWTWTAPANGFFRFGSLSGNAAITAYTGTCGAFVQVACNATAQQFIVFAVTAGVTYSIKLAGQFTGGQIAQRILAYATDTPANTACASPQVIASLPTTITADATLASDDTFISGYFSVKEYAALFYEWTCPGGFAGNVEIDTTGSRYQSQLCITTGACGARVELANAPWTNLPPSENSGFQSQAKLTFRPTPGTTYLIRVSNGAFVLGGGILTMTVREVTRPANEVADGALVLTAPSFVTQDNDGAADNQDPTAVPTCAADTSDWVQGKYLWFRWTAVNSNPVQVNTALSQDVRTGVAVYTGTPGALTEVQCEYFNFAVASARIIFTPSAGVTYYLRVWAESRAWCTLNLFLDELRTPLAGDVIVGCAAVWIFTPEGAVRDYLFLTGYANSGIPTNGSIDPATDVDLYISQLGQDQTAQIDVTTQPMSVVQYIPMVPGDRPEGNAFQEDGQLVIGFRAAADPADNVRTFAVPAATLLTTHDVQVGAEGSGWVDLASDRHTLYYTSGGREVYRYDLTASVQLPLFATLPASGVGTVIAQGVRLLADGGVVVADYSQVTRTDGAGAFTRAYTLPNSPVDVHVLDIDHLGTSIWVGVTVGNLLYRVNLDSGAILLAIDIPTFNGVDMLCGVAVIDGQRAIETQVVVVGVGCPAALPITPTTPICAAIGEL